MATKTETPAVEVGRDLALRMYEQMWRIRVFEEHVDGLYRSR
jgi:TPP-dependent pyruvate/acetoin dehydrogenase alpha subunit